MSLPKRARKDNDDIAPPSKRQKLSLNRRRLPIDACKEEILFIINNPQNDIIIITGDTGSGKSTQLSQILHHSKLYKSIIITQPRRIGAVSLSRRVSKEMNCCLGATVGFTIRFNDHSSPNTQIRYVTDGILLRELTNNGNNNGAATNTANKYDIIILDEAHERSLQTDILFSILRDMVKQQKATFKLLITSATLNVDKFSNFFLDAPVYHIQGRCFPVEVFHCTQQQRNYVDACIQTALQIHCNETDTHDISGELGHILCFLTGRGEIERACKRMGDKIDELTRINSAKDMADCVILAAYGSMHYDKQQQIFAAVPLNCRKIIFATNIAETSLTVDGIVYVIDAGLVKQKQFNCDSGMDELIINNISVISAIQRKGRCGRTSNGKCYRLYTKRELCEFSEETTPEILRSSLCSTILTLKALGITDVINNFEYLDKPNVNAFANALDKLYLLSAIDKYGYLDSDIGVKMAKLPLDPIYSKILIAAKEYKATDIALSLVAIISANNGNSSDLFMRPAAELSEEEKRKFVEAHQAFDSKYGDIISWLLLFNNFMKMAKEHSDDMVYEWTRKCFVRFRILTNALKIRKQLKDIIEKEFDGNVLSKQCMKPIKCIRKVLAKSLFMQTAKLVNNNYNKNDGDDKRRKLIFKTCECEEHIYIHPSSMSCLLSSLSASVCDLKWVVYLDILYTSKPFMRGICGIKYEWIKHLLPTITHKIEWIEKHNAQENNANKEEKCDQVVKDKKESNVIMTKDNNTQNNISIDSVKERYLKRKMLKNKLKSL